MTKEQLIKYFKNVLNDKTQITDQRGNEVIVFTRKEVEQILQVLEIEEPRLFTCEEMTKLKAGTDVWLEVYGLGRIDCAAATVEWIDKRVGQIGFRGIETFKRFRDYNRNMYFSWRLWSSSPTYEQRKETAWNGDN